MMEILIISLVIGLSSSYIVNCLINSPLFIWYRWIIYHISYIGEQKFRNSYFEDVDSMKDPFFAGNANILAYLAYCPTCMSFWVCLLLYLLVGRFTQLLDGRVPLLVGICMLASAAISAAVYSITVKSENT
jgi:hypothetical protein